MPIHSVVNRKQNLLRRTAFKMVSAMRVITVFIKLPRIEDTCPLKSPRPDMSGCLLATRPLYLVRKSQQPTNATPMPRPIVLFGGPKRIVLRWCSILLGLLTPRSASAKRGHKFACTGSVGPIAWELRRGSLIALASIADRPLSFRNRERPNTSLPDETRPFSRQELRAPVSKATPAGWPANPRGPGAGGAGRACRSDNAGCIVRRARVNV
jgi:hypothetical protein